MNKSEVSQAGRISSEAVGPAPTGAMPSGGPVCSPGRSEVIRESFYDSRTHGYLGTPESQDRQISSITELHSSLENPNFSPSMIERKSVSLVTNDKASTFFRQAI